MIMTGLALRVSVPKWNVESELGYYYRITD